MVTITSRKPDAIRPQDFGAIGDARRISGCTTTSASNAVTTTGVVYPTDVGRPIYLFGAGANGTCLVTTIASYVNSGSFTIGTNAAVTLAGTCTVLIGEDDTTAVQAAIDYAASQSAFVRGGVTLHGRFITGPLTLPAGATLFGRGRESAVLLLKPGSATVNKYHIKNLNVNAIGLVLQNLKLIGNRAAHTDGSGVVLNDINGIEYDYTGFSDELPQLNLMEGLTVLEYGRAGVKLTHRGRTNVSDVVISDCGLGMEVDSSYNLISNVSARALGQAFWFKSNAKNNQVNNCRGHKSGYDTTNVQGTIYSVWLLDGCVNNNFNNCEGQESSGSVWYLKDAKRNSLNGCRATDPGCLFTAEGLGPDNSAFVKSGFQLAGASDDNRFTCSVGIVSHGTTNYASHAVHVGGTSANNAGRVETDKSLTFGTAKINRSTSGVGNSLRVDGEMISKDKHTIPMHAMQFFTNSTNGALAVEFEHGTNTHMLETFNFDAATPESIQTVVRMPASWDYGTITFDVDCSQASAGAGGVAWGLKAVAIKDGDLLDQAWGTEVVVTKTVGDANKIYTTAESAALTVAGATTGTVLVAFRLTRVTGNGADTLAQDARFHGMRLYVNLKKENDA